MEKYEIEKQVTSLLKQYGYSFETDDYVDIVQFVQNFGFQVGTAMLQQQYDGFLAIKGKNDFDKNIFKSSDRVIAVNQERSFEWKRFIIAHEFGHFALHYQPEQTNELYLYRKNVKGRNECENDADYFAAALLMPEQSFSRNYDAMCSSELANNVIFLKLSSLYKVPFDSVIRRIEEIQVLKENKQKTI